MLFCDQSFSNKGGLMAISLILLDLFDYSDIQPQQMFPVLFGAAMIDVIPVSSSLGADTL